MFSGKVLDVKRLHTDISDINAVVFDVDRYWKSTNGHYYRELVVLTAVDDGACGYRFEAGKEYLVYGWSYSYDEGLYFVSLGSRTAPIDDAHEDLAFLGDGIIPTEHLNIEDQIARVPLEIKPLLQKQSPKEEVNMLIASMGIGMAVASAAMVLFIMKNREGRERKGRINRINYA
ncbi:MAG: hypothetical protein NZ517_00480 [Candidatus Nitrosocaldus sp.]|nr:hypothetical protein [Candidatus Nitrosocaldus sp.]